MADTEAENVREAGDDPASVSVDGQSVKSRPIPELLAARKFAHQSEAAARSGLPIKIGKWRPPGAV